MCEETKYKESILGEHLLLSFICVIEQGVRLKKLAEHALENNEVKLSNKLNYIVNSYEELAISFMKIINPEFDNVNLSTNVDKTLEKTISNDLKIEAKYISEMNDLFNYHLNVASKEGVIEITRLYKIAICVNEYNLLIMEEFYK